MREPALSLAIGQFNPLVNDIDANVARAMDFLGRHPAADLCVLSECFLTGYPFEDLAFRPGFIAKARLGLERLVSAVVALQGPALLVGLPMAGPDRPFNAAVLVHPSGAIQVANKLDLPNIGVFDEWRHFTPGAVRGPFVLRGMRVGVMICEEMWHGPVGRHLADERVDLLVAVNGSPFERGKQAVRLDHARRRVREAGCPLVYVNQVGGQDELVFDGASFALDADGTQVHQAQAFAEAEMRLQARRAGEGTGTVRLAPAPGDVPVPYPGDMEATYRALVLATRDYVGKNGFPGVVVGQSGGIDSALVTAISVDALGAAAVRAVTMPSRHNGAEGILDAAASARLTGASFESIPIQGIQQAFMAALPFAGLPPDVTEENLQARIRGTLLMSLSNKFGPMLLTTGNKSEMSVGYATLYGDMSGGFNPLKDILKTDVYALARWRNGAPVTGLLGPAGEVVPARVIDKPPSAELADGQTDEAALGPYPVLDELLRCIVERDLSPAEAAAETARALRLDPAAPCGRSPDLATHAALVARLVQRAEYKRRQSAPGPKVSSRNLGRDRRYPITTGGVLW